ncbi:MAG: hypothetical protein ABJC04_13850, partial [Verrucomicrobiota bacterium]
CLSHNVVDLDLQSGTVKKTIPFHGHASAFMRGDGNLLLVAEGGRLGKFVTQIALDSGEAKTVTVASSLRQAANVSRDLPPDVLPTASLLLKYELEGEQKNRPSLYKFSSEFFPAGQNLVEMQVKLLQPKISFAQNMKAPGKSHINSETTASTSSRAVFEELSNEMKRDREGGFKQVDESRYGVLLRRSLEPDAVDWKGEVIGAPAFFPMKTVDVLVAGKSLLLFDKRNKKIAESALSYPVADVFSSAFLPAGAAPCVEHDQTLFFFDQGVLTAFHLPDGEVRWRLPSVGISTLQFDEKGMLYVSTTTGSPEDVQYSGQIKMVDTIKPQLLKVNPASGKTLWKCELVGNTCFLTGKFVYLANTAPTGNAMLLGLEEGLGAQSHADANLLLFRLDPSNGERLWTLNKSGVPSGMDFFANRILLHYGNEIELLKYLSF